MVVAQARYMFVSIIIIMMMLVSSCEKKYALHPNPEHLPPDSAINFKVDFDSTHEDPLPGFIDYRNPKQEFLFNDSLLWNVYPGRILLEDNIEIDPLGNIYLHQYKRNKINVYNSNGNYSYSIGRAGRGPGEFQRVRSFDFNSDFTKLYVLDEFEIEIFGLENQRYNYEKSFAHNLVLTNSNICVLGDFLYVSGIRLKRSDSDNVSKEETSLNLPIHQFKRDSLEYLNSFGFVYHSYADLPRFNQFMSNTVLACNETTETVIGQLKDFPYMFGYSVEGELKWTSKFDNFLSTEFTETKQPTLLPSNEETRHWILPFREIYRGKYELIQVYHYFPFSYFYALSIGETPEKPTIKGPLYRTILVDSETGELFMSDSYGLLGAVRGNHAIGIDILDPDNFDINIYLYEF